MIIFLNENFKLNQIQQFLPETPAPRTHGTPRIPVTGGHGKRTHRRK